MSRVSQWYSDQHGHGSQQLENIGITSAHATTTNNDESIKSTILYSAQ